MCGVRPFAPRDVTPVPIRLQKPELVSLYVRQSEGCPCVCVCVCVCVGPLVYMNSAGIYTSYITEYMCAHVIYTHTHTHSTNTRDATCGSSPGSTRPRMLIRIRGAPRSLVTGKLGATSVLHVPDGQLRVEPTRHRRTDQGSHRCEASGQVFGIAARNIR